MGRGKLIVVEGLDNVGKTTFIDFFCKQNPLVSRRKFPSKRVIEMMNQGQFVDIDWNDAHDKFHENLQWGMEEIQKDLNSGFSVICDRYYYSHWVYENLRRNEEYICTFHNPVYPDIIIYLRPENLDLVTNRNKDNLENEIDYEKGQVEFDNLFAKRLDVITVPALQDDTNDKVIAALIDKFGVML